MLTGNNGKVKYVSCLMPDCYTTDELRVRGYCERHFRQLFVEKADKERDRHRLEAERLSSVINQLNAEVKQAKHDQGLEEQLPFLYCLRGCGFKSQFVRAIEAHQSLCGKKLKATATTGSTATPRAAAKPKHVKQALTEKDLF